MTTRSRCGPTLDLFEPAPDSPRSPPTHGWRVMETLTNGGKPHQVSRVFTARSAAEAFAALAQKMGRRVSVVFQ